MKKLIIANDVKSLVFKEESFLNRSEIRVFEVASNEEALVLHRAERADLVIVNLDSGAMGGEDFCRAVRDDADLRKVSIVVVGPADVEHMERAAKCRANAVLTRPLDIDALLEKSHALLNISKRVDFRAPIAVRVQGKAAGEPFLGYSENISASGLLFDSDNPLAVGDKLLCSFIVLDNVRVTADAEVVRVVDSVTEHEIKQYGIKFLRVSDVHKAAIEDFVNSVKKLE